MHPFSPLVVPWLLAAAPPSDAAPPWTLEWSAPSECPTAAEVDSTVAAWRAQGPHVATTGVEARAHVQLREGGTFALQLEIEADDVVTRHAVEATDCPALADATALQIAMALGIDPSSPEPTMIPAPQIDDGTTGTPNPTPPAPRDSPPAGSSATSSPVADAPTVRRTRPRGLLRMQGSVGTGRGPRIDGRLGLAGGVAWPRARVELVVAHTFEQRAPLVDREDVEIRVWQWTALARGCWTPNVGPVALPVCGGLEAGATQGRAVGVPLRRTASSPFVATVTTVGLAWPFARRFALWVAVDGWLGLTQPSFTIERLDPWFVTRRGGVDGVLGLEVRLP